MNDNYRKKRFDYFQYFWSIFVSLNHKMCYCCGQIKIKNLYADCLFDGLCYTETKVTHCSPVHIFNHIQNLSKLNNQKRFLKLCYPSWSKLTL